LTTDTTVGVVVPAAHPGCHQQRTTRSTDAQLVGQLGWHCQVHHRAQDGDDGHYGRIGTTGKGITTYTDAEIVAGTTYCYRVKAFNASEESGYSNEGCASSGASRIDERRWCRKSPAPDQARRVLRRASSARQPADTGVSIETEHRHVVHA